MDNFNITINDDDTPQGNNQNNRQSNQDEPTFDAFRKNIADQLKKAAEEVERVTTQWKTGSWPNVRTRINELWKGLAENETGSWIPQIEIREEPNAYVIYLDAPGMQRGDVEVEISDDALILKGERKMEPTEEGKRILMTERGYGAFARTLPLPEDANREEVSATFKEGVLEVRFGRVQVQKNRRIIDVQ
ncbi:MAG: Hsp20/alpha crystallin family protein [Chlorobi bacterium CHB2]|nr:Hsp20/alpha crystallin family protein [Chlorobi bacterium CHB2]